jgi:hypothetical protein
MPTTFYQRTAMAAAITACFPGAALAAGVARVDFASGNVTAVGADGRSRALGRGSEIEVGETIATQQGRAQLRFSDGAYMSLQPQTEFKVEEFKFSGKPDGSENIVMNLLKGGMRTITGLIGRTNRNAYRLKTDVATIGIRGTEYSVKYTNSIEVFVSDGAISVENQSGTFVVPGGSGVMVSNQNTAPQQTDQKPVLPPEGPAQREEERVHDEIPDPVNPIQESTPPVPATPPTPILTGTFEGPRVVARSFSTLGAQDASFTLNGAGELTSFVDTFEGSATVTLGTATPVSLGNDGVIAWGRWVNGVTGGDSFNFSNRNMADPFEGPLHYIVGLPATNMPTTGTGEYGMIGSSIYSNAGPASVISSGLSVNFASSSATFHGQFDVAGTTYSTGSGTPLTRSEAQLSGSGSMTGGACGSTIFLQGFLAGAGAVRAGMAFSFDHNFSGPVSGVIAYKKTN